MNASTFGSKLHAILEDFETASLQLRGRGLSDRTSDRIGLFLALCVNKYTVREAWAIVDEEFPPQPPEGRHT